MSCPPLKNLSRSYPSFRRTDHQQNFKRREIQIHPHEARYDRVNRTQNQRIHDRNPPEYRRRSPPRDIRPEINRRIAGRCPPIRKPCYGSSIVINKRKRIEHSKTRTSNLVKVSAEEVKQAVEVKQDKKQTEGVKQAEEVKQTEEPCSDNVVVIMDLGTDEEETVGSDRKHTTLDSTKNKKIKFNEKEENNNDKDIPKKVNCTLTQETETKKDSGTIPHLLDRTEGTTCCTLPNIKANKNSTDENEPRKLASSSTNNTDNKELSHSIQPSTISIRDPRLHKNDHTKDINNGHSSSKTKIIAPDIQRTTRIDPRIDHKAYKILRTLPIELKIPDFLRNCKMKSKNPSRCRQLNKGTTRIIRNKSSVCCDNIKKIRRLCKGPIADLRKFCCHVTIRRDECKYTPPKKSEDINLSLIDTKKSYLLGKDVKKEDTKVKQPVQASRGNTMECSDRRGQVVKINLKGTISPVNRDLELLIDTKKSYLSPKLPENINSLVQEKKPANSNGGTQTPTLLVNKDVKSSKVPSQSGKETGETLSAIKQQIRPNRVCIRRCLKRRYPFEEKEKKDITASAVKDEPQQAKKIGKSIHIDQKERKFKQPLVKSKCVILKQKETIQRKEETHIELQSGDYKVNESPANSNKRLKLDTNFLKHKPAHQNAKVVTESSKQSNIRKGAALKRNTVNSSTDVKLKKIESDSGRTFPKENVQAANSRVSHSSTLNKFSKVSLRDGSSINRIISISVSKSSLTNSSLSVPEVCKKTNIPEKNRDSTISHMQHIPNSVIPTTQRNQVCSAATAAEMPKTSFPNTNENKKAPTENVNLTSLKECSPHCPDVPKSKSDSEISQHESKKTKSSISSNSADNVEYSLHIPECSETNSTSDSDMSSDELLKALEESIQSMMSPDRADIDEGDAIQKYLTENEDPQKTDQAASQSSIGDSGGHVDEPSEKLAPIHCTLEDDKSQSTKKPDDNNSGIDQAKNNVATSSGNIEREVNNSGGDCDISMEEEQPILENDAEEELLLQVKVIENPEVKAELQDDAIISLGLDLFNTQSEIKTEDIANCSTSTPPVPNEVPSEMDSSVGRECAEEKNKSENKMINTIVPSEESQITFEEILKEDSSDREEFQTSPEENKDQNVMNDPVTLFTVSLVTLDETLNEKAPDFIARVSVPSMKESQATITIEEKTNENKITTDVVTSKDTQNNLQEILKEQSDSIPRETIPSRKDLPTATLESSRNRGLLTLSQILDGSTAAGVNGSSKYPQCVYDKKAQDNSTQCFTQNAKPLTSPQLNYSGSSTSLRNSTQLERSVCPKTNEIYTAGARFDTSETIINYVSKGIVTTEPSNSSPEYFKNPQNNSAEHSTQCLTTRTFCQESCSGPISQRRPTEVKRSACSKTMSSEICTEGTRSDKYESTINQGQPGMTTQQGNNHSVYNRKTQNSKQCSTQNSNTRARSQQSSSGHSRIKRKSTEVGPSICPSTISNESAKSDSIINYVSNGTVETHLSNSCSSSNPMISTVSYNTVANVSDKLVTGNSKSVSMGTGQQNSSNTNTVGSPFTSPSPRYIHDNPNCSFPGVSSMDRELRMPTLSNIVSGQVVDQGRDTVGARQPVRTDFAFNAVKILNAYIISKCRAEGLVKTLRYLNTVRNIENEVQSVISSTSKMRDIFADILLVNLRSLSQHMNNSFSFASFFMEFVVRTTKNEKARPFLSYYMCELLAVNRNEYEKDSILKYFKTYIENDLTAHRNIISNKGIPMTVEQYMVLKSQIFHYLHSLTLSISNSSENKYVDRSTTRQNDNQYVASQSTINNSHSTHSRSNNPPASSAPYILDNSLEQQNQQRTVANDINIKTLLQQAPPVPGNLKRSSDTLYTTSKPQLPRLDTLSNQSPQYEGTWNAPPKINQNNRRPHLNTVKTPNVNISATSPNTISYRPEQNSAPVHSADHMYLSKVHPKTSSRISPNAFPNVKYGAELNRNTMTSGTGYSISPSRITPNRISTQISGAESNMGTICSGTRFPISSSSLTPFCISEQAYGADLSRCSIPSEARISALCSRITPCSSSSHTSCELNRNGIPSCTGVPMSSSSMTAHCSSRQLLGGDLKRNNIPPETSTSIMSSRIAPNRFTNQISGAELNTNSIASGAGVMITSPTLTPNSISRQISGDLNRISAPSGTFASITSPGISPNSFHYQMYGGGLNKTIMPSGTDTPITSARITTNIVQNMVNKIPNTINNKTDVRGNENDLGQCYGGEKNKYTFSSGTDVPIMASGIVQASPVTCNALTAEVARNTKLNENNIRGATNKERELSLGADAVPSSRISDNTPQNQTNILEGTRTGKESSPPFGILRRELSSYPTPPSSNENAESANVREIQMTNPSNNWNSTTEEKPDVPSPHVQLPEVKPVITSPGMVFNSESSLNLKDEPDETIDLTLLEDDEVKLEPSNDSYSLTLEEPTESLLILHNRKCLCGKDAIYLCACNTVMYCCQECQFKDWQNHQRFCPAGIIP